MLASHLKMSVARAQKEIDSLEFTNWIAFRSRYGFADDKAELGMAQNSWLMYQLWKGKNAKAMDVADFMFNGKEIKTLTPDEAWNQMVIASNRMNRIRQNGGN